VSQYIDFFAKRGYNKKHLQETANEVLKLDRICLLTQKKPTMNDPNRIPLVLDYHHKYCQISRIIYQNYENTVKTHPQFKQVFPQPPIVAFRRQKNLKDRLVKAKHWRDNNQNKGSKSSIVKNMNTLNTIENPISKQKFNVQNISPSARNVVYAARCRKCNKLYVGSTSTPLNIRFNTHRSDVNCERDRCELPTHFLESKTCNFDLDIEISILEQVVGSRSKLLRQEEAWTAKLSAFKPTGLNRKYTEVTNIHKTLHRVINTA
jgi:hypothetical protein